MPVPNELVVAGQTVQLAAPNEVNELDLAANDAQSAGQRTSAQPTRRRRVPAKNEVAEATSKSDSLLARAATAVRDQLASQVVSQVSGNQVGSASWIAQVLAALGGAVAAGSAAWFLIGVTPQRTYG